MSALAANRSIDDTGETPGRLVESSPRSPTARSAGPAGEADVLDAQEVVEAAIPEQALTGLGNSSENRPGITRLPSEIARPNLPAAERTVGKGCTYATITAAVPGDTLLIEGGRIFIENIMIPMTLTLQGGYDGCATGSTDRTTIDGSLSGSVLAIRSAVAVTLHDSVLTNGLTGSGGGGIRFVVSTGGGSLDLVNVDISGNEALDGGGIHADNATVSVHGGTTTIRGNVAASNGGGIYAVNSRLWLEDTTLGGMRSREANQLGPNGHSGAGLYLVATHAALSNTTVAGNTFRTTGYAHGGGAYVDEGSVLTLTNSTIERHLAPSADDGRGAGL